jgi:hypothetical protein
MSLLNVIRNSAKIGLEVNTDKTKYMVMSRDRIAGRGDGVKIDSRSIERGRFQISGSDVNRSKFNSGTN